MGIIRLDQMGGDHDDMSSHPMMIENYKEKMAGVIEMLEKQEEFKKQAA